MPGSREATGDAVLDGEVVVFDANGGPSFTPLAERMHVRDKARAARLAASLPVTYMIFDLLRLDGVDLTGRPLAERRAALDGLGLGADRAGRCRRPSPTARRPWPRPRNTSWRAWSPSAPGSLYRPGVRTPDWVKVKLESTAEFVIGGWRPGVRKIGGLLVGAPADDGLAFRGRVGGGISAAAERELLAVLEPLVTPTSPFVTGDQSVPREDARGAIWVKPEIVVEVRYGQRTPDGRLRFPRFLRLRPDMTAEDVTDG